MTSRPTKFRTTISRMTRIATRRDLGRMISFTGMPDSDPNGGADEPKTTITQGEDLLQKNLGQDVRKIIGRRASWMMCKTE